ncbi:MAG: general secretion pathway protein GspK [Burkholderiaceae bacterium]|nr:general secretion pathway protein GspK [Burkholderiaceae bacterium]
MRRTSRRPAPGYVLVTVLLAMVLLALVAARLDQRLANFREASRQWGRWVQAQADLAGARDELLFLMATRRLTPLGFAGVPLLRVDGRPYRLPSGVRASVQDLRGLISIVSHDPGVMTRFLVAQGVPERDAAPLLDKLADYSDLDSLHRLNGAEADDYAAAGLPPPRNDWPLSPYELSLVLGWREHPQLWQRASDHFTAVRDGWLNPNTAPPEVLAALSGATPQAVRTLLDLREQGFHVSSAPALLGLTGIRLPDDPVAFYPGVFYRLRLWRAEDARAVEYTVMLAPDARTLPWLILETRQVRRPTHHDDQPDPPLLAVAAPVAAAASAATP